MLPPHIRQEGREGALTDPYTETLVEIGLCAVEEWQRRLVSASDRQQNKSNKLTPSTHDLFIFPHYYFPQ